MKPTCACACMSLRREGKGPAALVGLARKEKLAGPGPLVKPAWSRSAPGCLDGVKAGLLVGLIFMGPKLGHYLTSKYTTEMGLGPKLGLGLGSN